ncbi:cold shock domain-containing protein [Mycolicibacterium goodii]|uniref:cold-shock protein n=1 Tax=Mycolicibacterium goodii TaxID=134601 RepID=UPI001F049C4A|nr:cold shock domain-containing protein [Mycolicibacterium goodii]ULN44922.1 cold shock domain-containing protein [Mycolicibacterium goodii]
MPSKGTVRVWHSTDGWGLIDSADTPGGCFAHFTHIANMSGFRELREGETVEFEFEPGSQDGYDFRALSVQRVSDGAPCHSVDNGS